MIAPRRSSLLAAGLIAAAFGLTCGDGTGPRLYPRASVVLAPVLPAIPNLSGALGITNFRVIIGTPPAVKKDTTYTFVPGVDSILVNLVVPNTSAGDVLTATVQGRAGSTVLFSGTITVTARGSGTPTPPGSASIPLPYVGPGGGVAAITVLPRDTAVIFGDSARYRATAIDSASATVTTFYAVYGSPDTSVRVNLQGYARAPAPAARPGSWASRRPAFATRRS